MKAIKLTLLILLFPLLFFGQTLNGVWTGTISNDSTTVRKDQSFEMVLTQYKNKVYGFSRNDFIVNDTLFYIVKRVKGTIEGDVCEVIDDEIVSYNFRGRLNKGVKVITTFRLDHNDSTWKMSGDWKTNKTKKFYSISGKADLKEEKDLSKSKIFPHLEELKLADEIVFYKEAKKVQEPVVAVKQPAKNIQKEQPVKENKPAVIADKEIKTDVAAAKQPETKETPGIVAVKDNNKNNTAVVKNDAAAIKQKPEVVTVKDNKNENRAIVQVKTEPAKENKQTVPDNKKSEPIAITKPAEEKKDVAINTKNTEIKKQETSQPVSMFKESDRPSNTTKPEVKPAAPIAAVSVAERKVAAPQIVNFQSDSLELALYDNGEVDGDTVSVLLDGEIILAKQGLKTTAIKKTIYASNDSLTMVLYAENLGKYPPNTGLLVIHDGDETYYVRFSADLQQNAAVIFKRKKK